VKLVAFALLGIAASAAALLGPPQRTPAGPEVGKPAPKIRLNDHAGKIVEIGGAAKSWTVLAFFPKAATPG